MEVPAGLHSYLELAWGRVQLQVHSGYQHNSFPCDYMAEDPSFFAGYWLEATQILEAFCTSLPCGSLQQSGTFRKPKGENLLRSAKMQSYVTLTHQSAVRPPQPHFRMRSRTQAFLSKAKNDKAMNTRRWGSLGITAVSLIALICFSQQQELLTMEMTSIQNLLRAGRDGINWHPKCFFKFLLYLSACVREKGSEKGRQWEGGGKRERKRQRDREHLQESVLSFQHVDLRD